MTVWGVFLSAKLAPQRRKMDVWWGHGADSIPSDSGYAPL